MDSVKSALCVFLFVTTATVVSSLAIGTKYAPCEKVSQSAIINKVTVNPCAAVPCQLKKGTNVSVDVDFTMTGSAKTATTDVHGIIAGVPVEYQTDFHDACKTAGLKCPLQSKSRNIYSAKLNVKSYYPSINLYVKWELQDETKKDIFCFEIPVEIVS